MDTLSKVMAGRIRLLRQQVGMTQAELAAKLEVSTALVTQWEMGVRKPSLPVIVALAKTLGVSVDYIVGAQETPQAFLDEEMANLFQEISTLPKKDRTVIREIVKVLKNLNQ